MNFKYLIVIISFSLITQHCFTMESHHTIQKNTHFISKINSITSPQFIACFSPHTIAIASLAHCEIYEKYQKKYTIPNKKNTSIVSMTGHPTKPLLAILYHSSIDQVRANVIIYNIQAEGSFSEIFSYTTTILRPPLLFSPTDNVLMVRGYVDFITLINYTDKLTTETSSSASKNYAIPIGFNPKNNKLICFHSEKASHGPVYTKDNSLIIFHSGDIGYFIYNTSLQKTIYTNCDHTLPTIAIALNQNNGILALLKKDAENAYIYCKNINISPSLPARAFTHFSITSNNNFSSECMKFSDDGKTLIIATNTDAFLIKASISDIWHKEIFSIFALNNFFSQLNFDVPNDIKKLLINSLFKLLGPVNK